MRRKPHDKRAKILLEAFHSQWAEVHPEGEVTRQQQSVDMVVAPRPGEVRDLGLPLLRRMSGQLCLFEVFHNTPGLAEVRGCIRKQLGYHHQMEMAARRMKQQRPSVPPLWILSSGRPETALRAFQASAMEGWPTGFWQMRPVDAVHIVAINRLPTTRDTLPLRLLGRGPTLRRALEQLRELPADSVENRLAMPVLLEFQILMPDDEVEEEMLNSWQEIRMKYEGREDAARREGELRGRRAGKREGRRAGRREGRRQGMRAFLLHQLEKRFVDVPVRYVRRVKRADDAQLEVWGERILAARTLDEIFA